MHRNTPPDSPDYGHAENDITTLKTAFSLHNWHYTDVAQQAKLAAIYDRWLLLAECNSAMINKVK